MPIQQPAQHRQQANTVYVAAPKAGDTVTVRVVSGTVQVSDTLHAVVRQTGGEGYALASLFLTLVLVGATIWAQLRINRLQTTNNNLQAEHAKLQREFNQMEAQHEAERRDAEQQRQQDHERATDARVSGHAFAMRRHFWSWLGEVPTGMAGLLQTVQDWSEARSRMTPEQLAADRYRGTNPEAQSESVEWMAKVTGPKLERAEARMLELVALAPDASAPVAAAIRKALVLFYTATHGFEQEVALYGEIGEIDDVRFANAYHDFVSCADALNVAVGPELQKAEQYEVLEGPGDG